MEEKMKGMAFTRKFQFHLDPLFATKNGYVILET